MEQTLINMSIDYPIVMTLCLIVGVFRAVFKPAMALLETYVVSTPSTSDDEKLAAFKNGKTYKILAWLVDYALSIKLPKPAPKDVPPSQEGN